MSRLNESIKRYKSGVCWLLTDSFSRKRSVVFKRGLKKKKGGKGCLNTCQVVRTSDSTSSLRELVKYIYIFQSRLQEKLALHDYFLFNFSFLPPHRLSYIYIHTVFRY